MNWFTKQDNYQETIARTGFVVSVTAYLWFWLADVVKPGLVSNYMSVHWWLLASLAFGVWWMMVLKRSRNRPVINYGLSVILGIIAAVLVWNIGLNLDEYRFMAVLIALILPIAVVGVLRSRE